MNENVILKQVIKKINDRLEMHDNKHKMLTDCGSFKQADILATRISELIAVRKIVENELEESKKPVRPIRVNEDRTDGCPICGREFYEKFNFCPKCGTEIKWGESDEHRSNV